MDNDRNLKQRTAQGLFWAMTNNGATQVLNLVIGIFLARLLTPTEYGIVGVLAIFTAIAGDLQSAGFTQGLINLPRPTVRDYNSVFSFNVCASVIMYAILFCSAPLIAWFFNQPCLTSVSRVLFLSFFISSLGIAHGGYMTKNMMNREFAILGILAIVCSGTVGISLAMLGYSYWSLVWQQITYVFVANALRYVVVKQWRPRLTLDFGPVKEMLPFSVKILVTKIINTVSGNVLTVIFGRLFPMHAVGNYSQAYKWNVMAYSLVSNTVGQLAQTVLVEGGLESETDIKARELRIFRKMVRFTCYVTLPMMFGLALVADEFILVTVGQEWSGCVGMLRVLCLSGAFMPLYVMYQNLTISQGRSDLYMRLNITQIVLQVAVILLCHRYGIFTMVCAYSVFLILWLGVWHAVAGRLVAYRFADMLKDVVPFAIAAAATMLAVWYITQGINQPHLLLCLRIVVASVLYFVLMFAAKVQIQRECLAFMRGIVHR